MYTSYATPIFLRMTSGRDKLIPGPFSLGRWYLPIGSIACAWVTFIVVLLCFPMTNAANSQNMNYAVVIIMAVFVFAAAWWVISARTWFVGPLPNVEDEGSLASTEKLE